MFLGDCFQAWHDLKIMLIVETAAQKLQIHQILITLESVKKFYHKVKRPRVLYSGERADCIDRANFAPVFIEFRVVQTVIDLIDQRLNGRCADLYQCL